MESEFLLNFKELSIEIVVIGCIVFGLTMLIKWPIKKMTAQLDENKRKAVNTVIVFIPMLLSFLLNGLYYGLFKNIWFTSIVFESAGSVYLTAVTVFAIFSRVMILIKGTKTTSDGDDFSKETLKFIKNNIKIISKTVKKDENTLKALLSKIEQLMKLRNEINCIEGYQDIAGIENIDNQISDLKVQQSSLETNIHVLKEKITNYQKSLKGEENGTGRI